MGSFTRFIFYWAFLASAATLVAGGQRRTLASEEKHQFDLIIGRQAWVAVYILLCSPSCFFFSGHLSIFYLQHQQLRVSYLQHRQLRG